MILTVTANPAIDKVYFLDEFIMGNTYRPKSMSVTAGGKGLNVSRVASILKEDVIAMGFLGGSSGDFIREQVQKSGITDAFTQIKGETRTCINISDNKGSSGEILESGPTVSAEEADAFLSLFGQNVDACDIVCVSGSLPKGLDSSFYCRLIGLCNERNKPIIVDTSGNTLRDIINEAPFMIKPNCDELYGLTGTTPKDKKEIKNFLYSLKAKNISLPLVTLGKDGAAALIDNKYYHFAVPEVTVKNSVGSGDSTIAGIAVGICRGLSMLNAVRLGMAAGIANTQFSETGVVTTDLVKEYYNKIIVTEI